MKMKFFTLLAIAAMFSFASCKKDRTCECTVTILGTTTTTSGTIKATKKDAKEACEKGNSAYSTCELK